jgi:hypothetical protein
VRLNPNVPLPSTTEVTSNSAHAFRSSLPELARSPDVLDGRVAHVTADSAQPVSVDRRIGPLPVPLDTQMRSVAFSTAPLIPSSANWNKISCIGDLSAISRGDEP